MLQPCVWESFANSYVCSLKHFKSQPETMKRARSGDVDIVVTVYSLLIRIHPFSTRHVFHLFQYLEFFFFFFKFAAFPLFYVQIENSHKNR